MASKLPSVVLVGRPNVGKSTLFNRIVGARRAIVAPIAGTTRDAIAQGTSWRGVDFQVVDTGGLYGASEDPLHELVVRHGQWALDAADLVVFVVDGREGVASGDETITQELRRRGLPVILAINKLDDKRAEAGALDFWRLGFDPVVEISAEHGMGVADLLDEVITRVGRPAPASPNEVREDDDEATPTAGPDVAVAVIGRPNVGKSSLLNRLMREERALVSELPGTTRDPVTGMLTWHRRQFRIVDTAGLRRPGRVRSGGAVELVSVAGTKRAITEADVVALLVDALEGATDQDAAIGGEADRMGRGIVIVANKWDLVKDRGENYSTVFDDELRRKMRFLDYAPILHISALTGERAGKVLEALEKVAAERLKRIPTPALNAFVEAVTAANPPVSPERRHVRILYAAQIRVAPPTFVFFTNVATSFHFSYTRFLVNQLRERFGFEGTPIRVEVRRRKKRVRGGRSGRTDEGAPIGGK